MSGSTRCAQCGCGADGKGHDRSDQGRDRRFFGIGDKLPVLPLAQFVAGINVRNLGIELAYAGIVASVSLNWRL
jgi:hypothetical protein